MAKQPETRLRPAALPPGRPVSFALVPDAEQRRALAERLGLIALRKLSLRGELRPQGQSDWILEATLGATVVQPCVATLAPVTTRIDEPVIYHYLAEMPGMADAEEVEMPEDETLVPLPEIIDLEQIMEEALALALPLYPRAEGAETAGGQFAAPGVAPMTDEDSKPFAGLGALKGRLEGKHDKDGEDDL